MKPIDDICASLPLTEATFFVLLSLAPGPKHGYGIMKEIPELSRGRVSFSTSTLYGALKRLLDQGWIERAEDDALDETTRPKNTYSLSPTGRLILKAEIARLRDLVQISTSVQTLI
jgi:DNA-binding PadR family transcriptional regulator